MLTENKIIKTKTYSTEIILYYSHFAKDHFYFWAYVKINILLVYTAIIFEKLIVLLIHQHTKISKIVITVGK